jgi:hypothetical protein
MKLILREYLASLRERAELDAILPDLLSELGFNVYSRPGRGTVQRGVDVAAVGCDDEGRAKVYLFTIKRGDLSRQDWNGSDQALRPSLDDIIDTYIPTHIPEEHKGLPVVVCVCFGGDVKEPVRLSLTQYEKSKTTATLGFEEWNGDKIANLLLQGVLREDLLPKPFRSDFQKAVALLDEPEISYRHFARLVRDLLKSVTDEKSRVRVARQIYICLWVLYVWGRDVSNVEAPYRGSEVAILSIWELVKPLIDKPSPENRALATVMDQTVQLHLLIATGFIEERIAPFSTSRDAIGMAVGSRSAVDVSLKLFDLLGRIALTGVWLKWLGDQAKGEEGSEPAKMVGRYFDIGMSLIESNSALNLPLCDDQATDISLFLMLCLWNAEAPQRLIAWLESMVSLHDFTVRANGRYPTSLSEYTDLVEHPRQLSKDYFEEATAGSTLIPVLAMWCKALRRPELATRLARLTTDKLAHCTMQAWTPGNDSEQNLYVNSNVHGLAITGLPINDGGAELAETVIAGCKEGAIDTLSAIKTGMWPIVLTACRHWRLPVPPDFYVYAIMAGGDDGAAERVSN